MGITIHSAVDIGITVVLVVLVAGNEYVGIEKTIWVDQMMTIYLSI
jgi:hypothetical protein